MTAKLSYRTALTDDASPRSGTGGEIGQRSPMRRMESRANLNLAALALFAAPMRLLCEPATRSDSNGQSAGETAGGPASFKGPVGPVPGTQRTGHRGYDR